MFKFPQVIYLEQDYLDNLEVAFGHVVENVKNISGLELEYGKKVLFWEKKDKWGSQTHYLLAVIFEKSNPIPELFQISLIVEQMLHKNSNMNRQFILKETCKKFDIGLEEYHAQIEKEKIKKLIPVENQLPLKHKIF